MRFGEVEADVAQSVQRLVRRGAHGGRGWPTLGAGRSRDLGRTVSIALACAVGSGRSLGDGLPAEPGKERFASRGEPVSGAEALGKAKLFQYSNVPLEAGLVLTDSFGELSGTCGRVVSQESEQVCRPGSGSAGGVEPGEAGAQPLHVVSGQVGGLAERDSRILALVLEGDSVECSLGRAGKVAQQTVHGRVSRGLGIRGRDLGLCHGFDRADREDADGRLQRPARSDGGTAPPAERQRHAALSDLFVELLLE
jgi:hypothetical protein